MSTTIDEVIDTVREARHRGPDALAALALCYGADAVGWMIRYAALRREMLDAERGMDEAREERDAAREALAAKDSAPDLDYPARAEVWKLRESVDALRADRARAVAERDRAVQERESFSLRLSAVERQRDEARQERDAALARPTYEARKVAPTVAQWRGHFAAGGSWLVLRSTWSPLVVVDPDTYPGILGTEGATWLPLGPDGLPCAWPVVP